MIKAGWELTGQDARSDYIATALESGALSGGVEDRRWAAVRSSCGAGDVSTSYTAALAALHLLVRATTNTRREGETAQ